MRIKSDKKKERLVFLLTGIGIMVVLVIWGFQLSQMIKNSGSSQIDSDVSRAIQDLEEAQDLAEQIKQSIPFLQVSLDEIMNQSQKEKTQQATNDVLLDIGSELSNELKLQEIEKSETDESTTEDQAPEIDPQSDI